MKQEDYTSAYSGRSGKSGLPAGSLIRVGMPRDEPVSVYRVEFNQTEFIEQEIIDAAQCSPSTNPNYITWINVDGVHNIEIIKELGRCYGIHPLVLEDILNTEHRPKVEEYDDYLFLVFKLLQNSLDTELDKEQINLIIGERFLISFQEKPGDAFETIRQRLKKGPRTDKMSPDYIAYMLLDVSVDKYFSIMDMLGERIEELEDDLITDPRTDTIHRIHALKQELLEVRRAVWPLRDLINNLDHFERRFVKETTLVYIRDIYDHVVSVIDIVETLRDITSSMVDIYLSSVSYRLNEVMKVLTIIATIFIPLTFIVGIYGMNFRFMPELHWKWSYPIVWAVMLAIAVYMLWRFKKSKWL